MNEENENGTECQSGKEVLEKRHEEELQQLKADFAKQTQQLVTTQQASQSSNNYVSQTSSLSLDQSAYQSTTMHAGMQQSTYNGVGGAYLLGTGTPSIGGLGLGQSTAHFPSNTHAPQFENHAHGFPGQTTTQFGLGNGQLSQKGHGMPVRNNNFLSSQPELNQGPFHSNHFLPTSRSGGESTWSHFRPSNSHFSNDVTSGYLGDTHNAKSRDVVTTNGVQSGSMGIQNGSVGGALHSSPWVPEFYTHNPLLPKEAAPNNGVSLELMNGPPMRVNTSILASQIRPDLDFEDRMEQQREFFEEKFVEEKTQLRRSLHEDFLKRIEVERQKHEESVQILQTKNLELEHQRKEADVKIRQQQEKFEEKFESFRLECEGKIRKETETSWSKSSVKFEMELQQQKTKYELIIDKQKQDIESLTIQLQELNVSLEQEKDAIVTKFENEVKEIEERLKIKKEKTDSEIIVKLNSEISFLKSVNDSLREEIDKKDHEKLELEAMIKEDRKTIEANCENQINEIEAHFDEEKKVLTANCEEKVVAMAQVEKSSYEELSKALEGEIVFLKEENESLKKLAEKNYINEQQMYNERDEMIQELMKKNELLRMELQKNEKSATVATQNEEMRLSLIGTQKELSEATEMCAKLQSKLKRAEKEKSKLTILVKDLQTEIQQLTVKQHETVITKEEKEGLLKEVTRLNEEIDKMFEDVKEKGKKEIKLNEKLAEVEKTLEEQEKEATELRMEKLEHQSKINVLERQNEDLKEDLSILRKQKIEVDEDILNTRKEISDSTGQISVLKTTNGSLLHDVENAKRKLGEAQDEVNTLKHGNLDLEQQVRVLKMQQARYQDTIRARSDVSESGSVTTSADETSEASEVARHSRKSSLEKKVSKLKRSKASYEATIDRLKTDIKALENEAMKQIEHNKAVSAEFVLKKEEFKKEMDQKKLTKKTLEDGIAIAQQQQREIEGQLVFLEKQKKELNSAVRYLLEEEKRIKEANENEANEVSKNLEMSLEQTRREIAILESNKKEVKNNVERMERDEASLRCSVEELQKESELLSQRISEMNQNLTELGRKRVSWMEDETTSTASLGVKELKEEMKRLKIEKDVLLRSVNEFERKQMKLDISVTASERHRQLCEKEVSSLTQKKKELDSAIFTLKTKRFELETKVSELTATTVELSTTAQREEIEMLRNELQVARESCENIRSMYSGVQNAEQSKVEIVQAELRMAEDNLVTLKRERLELEKIISTLLRQKTELEAEVAMVVDAKNREDRDTTALHEERLDLDAEVMRLRSYIVGLRTVLSTLEDARDITERELESLETRKEKVERYISGMEASILIGQAPSPVSWNFNQSKEYVLTPRDDLEKQVVKLKEQKLALETDLFKLRRKSGDGIDTSRSSHGSDLGERLGQLRISGDYGAHYSQNESGSLHLEVQGLAQEKSKLSNELSEMKVRKTDLDTEITNLEYRKLGLEQSGRLVARREEGRDGVISRLSISSEMTQTEECSTMKDFLDYNVEQMQDLRKKNSSLEEKLSILERNLHESRFEIEKQTMEYQKDLRLLQDTIKSQDNDPHQLSVIVDRLKTVIRNSELSNTGQLYEEIRTEIKQLNKKVDANSRKMIKIQEYSSHFDQRQTTSSNGVLKEDDVEEICGYIKEAEDGLEGYNNIVVHLQKENGDLMEIVTKLEERLAAAGKSQEILQRKKAILQETLEKVEENTGEDLIKQTNLIFELDKDLAV